MKRRVIKLSEDGTEIVKEDGSFEFEEIEFEETNPIEENKIEEKKEPISNNDEVKALKEEVQKLKNLLTKTANISTPPPNIEPKQKYEDSTKSSLGFTTAVLKRRS
ncbi:hypothetical protein SCORR_v1c04650 [Spiroplasma corruscae]|uniref:Uncharacterized protein n=1 Tax=Spiroplasma corruscae TaxID=216934 RepID=A0A222EP13_9MOLU|nr:hypothetical protein [Spiroplasma corruscae]ASP28237.1 hypothetical protein SCORR_v1c04650 [Spiroplasma corruscae]